MKQMEDNYPITVYASNTDILCLQSAPSTATNGENKTIQTEGLQIWGPVTASLPVPVSFYVVSSRYVWERKAGVSWRKIQTTDGSPQMHSNWSDERVLEMEGAESADVRVAMEGVKVNSCQGRTDTRKKSTHS